MFCVCSPAPPGPSRQAGPGGSAASGPGTGPSPSDHPPKRKLSDAEEKRLRKRKLAAGMPLGAVAEWGPDAGDGAVGDTAKAPAGAARYDGVRACT